MSLTGVALGTHLETRFRVPIALGNDCNLGTLGEVWLGSARAARSAFGIFVGTGIGGGLVRKGKLWRGAREAVAPGPRRGVGLVLRGLAEVFERFSQRCDLALDPSHPLGQALDLPDRLLGLRCLGLGWRCPLAAEEPGGTSKPNRQDAKGSHRCLLPDGKPGRGLFGVGDRESNGEAKGAERGGAASLAHIIPHSRRSNRISSVLVSGVGGRRRSETRTDTDRHGRQGLGVGRRRYRLRTWKRLL